MKVRIHRGASEIGGSCVEIESQGQRILLDLGRPLEPDPEADLELPVINGLRVGDTGHISGLIISHPHQDHWGLATNISKEVPVYMGESASRILQEAAFFMWGQGIFHPAGYLRNKEPFEIGPFRVTPFLMDHSAFDSYSLLVEADGKRLFYTGDFREHGRKAALFERLVSSPPPNVDALLMEGTHIKPESSHERKGPTSEEEVQTELERVIREATGIVLVCYSPQNIDRYVSLFKACKKAKRELVIDLYTAAIVAATGLDSIPVAGWSGIRVFVPRKQCSLVKREKAFERVNHLGTARISQKALAESRERLVMTFRLSMAQDLEDTGCLSDATVIWSMWEGYLRPPAGAAMRDFFLKHGIHPQYIHTSGHASIPDLQRLAKAIDPGCIVPMHTAAPERFMEFFSHVKIRNDGEWWDV